MKKVKLLVGFLVALVIIIPSSMHVQGCRQANTEKSDLLTAVKTFRAEYRETACELALDKMWDYFPDAETRGAYRQRLHGLREAKFQVSLLDAHNDSPSTFLTDMVDRELRRWSVQTLTASGRGTEINDHNIRVELMIEESPYQDIYLLYAGLISLNSIVFNLEDADTDALSDHRTAFATTQAELNCRVSNIKAGHPAIACNPGVS